MEQKIPGSCDEIKISSKPKTAPYVSVVIPLYCSEKTIGFVVNEVRQELERLNIADYEIILVNDCSPDNVLAVAGELALQDKNVKVVSLARNSGQTAAMMVGYRYASGKFIINMDDDGQHPGNEIGKLLETLEREDLDVVFARYGTKKQSGFRIFGSFINQKMAEIMVGKPKGIRTNSFFVMRKFVRDEIIRYTNNYPYIFGIIFAVTGKVGNTDVIHRPRLEGKSNYNLRKLFALWFNGFLNFSAKPLRISTVLGFVIAAVAVGAGVWTLISRILNPDAPLGWASTMIVILFFAGVQLASIGLLGEYLGRLYISSSKLPTAVVRETINLDDL